MSAIYLLAFTQEGAAICNALLTGLISQGETCYGYVPERYQRPPLLPLVGNVYEWTEHVFTKGQGIVFIGACGIAVRAIAPHLKGKERDPAVVVVDQRGQYAISLLSGHLGGANHLARQVAQILDAVPVITTGTDICEVFAVDVWAKEQQLTILELSLAREVSARLLDGKYVGFDSAFPVTGPLPKGLAKNPADLGIYVGLNQETCPFPRTLHLVPRIVYAGMGCRKGVDAAVLEQQLLKACGEAHVSIQGLAGICTIDRKASELGLVALCEKYGVPLKTFPARVLGRQHGDFASSAFVREQVGVDNVCERAAIAACNGQGALICGKRKGSGVTVALARQDWQLRFV